MLDTIHSAPAKSVHGTILVPGDKSISHRALMFAALAEGVSEITGFLKASDCLATMQALMRLGVRIEIADDCIRVQGCRSDWHAVAQPINLGNSGTAIRLLTGLLAGKHISVTLEGDDSLNRRPMRRVVEPLLKMGADIRTAAHGTPPVIINAVKRLHGIRTDLSVASAQVKSALMLAGLAAQGKTVITEPALSRDHSERMLSNFGCSVIRQGLSVQVAGGSHLQATHIEVPGDISSATFLIIAAALVAASDLVIERVGLNDTRIGGLKILRRMGADIAISNEKIIANEPVGDIRIRSANLHGIEIPPPWVTAAIDEFPALFIAAAAANGRTYLRGAQELRVKESDRIATMAQGLRNCGITVEVYDDGIAIEGGQLKGGVVDSHGDHRVAMAFAVAGAVADSAITVQQCRNIETSFPNFITVANTVGLRLSD